MCDVFSLFSNPDPISFWPCYVLGYRSGVSCRTGDTKCPKSCDPFYILTYYKIGHYFLNRRYITNICSFCLVLFPFCPIQNYKIKNSNPRKKKKSVTNLQVINSSSIVDKFPTKVYQKCT